MWKTQLEVQLGGCYVKSCGVLQKGNALSTFFVEAASSTVDNIYFGTFDYYFLKIHCTFSSFYLHLPLPPFLSAEYTYPDELSPSYVAE